MKPSQLSSRSALNAGRPPARRSAFTLLELLLVLGVMVTLVTLSWPRLMRSLKQQSVQGNVEQVRQVLDHARVRAVEEGRILQFRFEPNGRRYVLLPLDPFHESQLADAAPASLTTSFKPATVTSDPFRIYELGAECFFHVDPSLLTGEAVVAEHLPDAWAGHLENAIGLRDIPWSAAILYYPDGTASDASIVVMDQQRQFVKLHVRGLTGAVWTEPLAVMAERLGTTGK